MAESRLHEVARHGQSIWIDNLSRDLVHRGELQRLIEQDAVTGVTSNPTIFDKAISGGDAYDAQIAEVSDAAEAGEGVGANADERVFFERVPLPGHARERVRPSDPWAFAELAEGIEAWGWRWTQEHGQLMDRGELARRWYEEEYVPVVTLLRDAGMLGRGTEADAYQRVGADRYRLLRTHEWSEDVLARLRAEQA